MRPGETVDVRTANAIAAVRGTFLVAETGGTGAGAISEFTVVSDRSALGVGLTQLDPTTGAAIPGALVLRALDNLRAVGAQHPAVTTLTLAQAQAKTTGLAPTSPQHSPAQEEAIAPAQLAQATALAVTLSGDPARLTPPAPLPVDVPIEVSTADIGVNEVRTTQAAQESGSTAPPIMFGPLDVTSPPLSPPCSGSNCNLLENGGFETGSFAPGWTLAGAGAVIGTFGSTTTLPPPQGSFQAIGSQHP
jgi:hypothetical protein